MHFTFSLHSSVSFPHVFSSAHPPSHFPHPCLFVLLCFVVHWCYAESSVWPGLWNYPLEPGGSPFNTHMKITTFLALYQIYQLPIVQCGEWEAYKPILIHNWPLAGPVLEAQGTQPAPVSAVKPCMQWLCHALRTAFHSLYPYSLVITFLLFFLPKYSLSLRGNHRSWIWIFLKEFQNGLEDLTINSSVYFLLTPKLKLRCCYAKEVLNTECCRVIEIKQVTILFSCNGLKNTQLFFLVLFLPHL